MGDEILNICIVSGSHRLHSQSRRVSDLIKNLYRERNVEAQVIDLAQANLPFWSEDFWTESENAHKKIWEPYSRQLKSADGFVFVAPEWGGMVPAALKNFFLLCGNKELAHKPALIVAISSVLSGSYPISELRMSSYKNTKVCYIPEHIIIRQVNAFCDDENYIAVENKKIFERLNHTLDILKMYTEALKTMRSHELARKLELYPHGM